MAVLVLNLISTADYQYALTGDDMHNGINPLSKCSGKKTCEVTVRNWWQHVHGDADYLVVTYICDPGGEPQTREEISNS